MQERCEDTSNTAAALDQNPWGNSLPGVTGLTRADRANRRPYQPYSEIKLLTSPARRLIYPPYPSVFSSPHFPWAPLPRNFTFAAATTSVRILPQSFFLGRTALLLLHLARRRTLLYRPSTTPYTIIVHWPLRLLHDITLLILAPQQHP